MCVCVWVNIYSRLNFIGILSLIFNQDPLASCNNILWNAITCAKTKERPIWNFTERIFCAPRVMGNAICVLSSPLHPTENREIPMTDLMVVKSLEGFFWIKKIITRNGHIIKFPKRMSHKHPIVPLEEKFTVDLGRHSPVLSPLIKKKSAFLNSLSNFLLFQLQECFTVIGVLFSTHYCSVLQSQGCCRNKK